MAEAELRPDRPNTAGGSDEGNPEGSGEFLSSLCRLVLEVAEATPCGESSWAEEKFALIAAEEGFGADSGAASSEGVIDFWFLS